jgi:hypothetical protein
MNPQEKFEQYELTKDFIGFWHTDELENSHVMETLIDIWPEDRQAMASTTITDSQGYLVWATEKVISVEVACLIVDRTIEWVSEQVERCRYDQARDYDPEPMPHSVCF